MSAMSSSRSPPASAKGNDSTAYSQQQRRQLLEVSAPKTREVVRELNDYLARTGLATQDFARRINYSGVSVRFFLDGKYENVASNDSAIRAAIHNFIQAHPVAVTEEGTGRLYETSNVKLLRKYFDMALVRHRAVYVHGAPGSQKSFVLQHLVAELNRTEIPKNGHGRRAFYVYCRQNIRPLDLMKRVSESAGAITQGSTDRILRNLRFDWRGRDVLLVFDEAQHLNVECFETLRELLDRPPYCGLLFAGSHQLQSTFVLNAIQLEQWNSRFHFGQELPGIQRDEAGHVLRSELGKAVTAAEIDEIIKQATTEEVAATASASTSPPAASSGPSAISKTRSPPVSSPERKVNRATTS
jgi:DNA transposition AAA+ family ATPase